MRVGDLKHGESAGKDVAQNHLKTDGRGRTSDMVGKSEIGLNTRKTTTLKVTTSLFGNIHHSISPLKPTCKRQCRTPILVVDIPLEGQLAVSINDSLIREWPNNP